MITETRVECQELNYIFRSISRPSIKYSFGIINWRLLEIKYLSEHCKDTNNA